MRMPSFRALPAAALALALSLAARGALADPVQVVASDARGVTLRIAIPSPGPMIPAPDGRARLDVAGFDLTTAEGEPRLPFAGALIALPPGARASVAVIDGGHERAVENVDLELGPKPIFRPDAATGELVPGWDPAPPVRSGTWPAASVVLGEPYVLRRQRLVQLTVYPYRYDAAARRLFVRDAMTVRVSFAGAVAPLAARPAAGEEDRGADAMFDGVLANSAEAHAWREPRTPMSGRSLFDRVKPSAALGAPGFDEDEPEVRALLDSTGVWTLDYATLAAAGFPAGVPIAEVSVHRHEFLEDAAVPYETIEIPVDVVDANANGTFDAGDRVVVWILDWARRSGASIPQRAWGDGEVVYVTRVRSPRAGLRMEPRAGWRNATGLTPLPSYPQLLHFERNLSYFNTGGVFTDTTQDAFHWTSIVAYYQRDESVQFETNDLDTSRSARVDVSWQGRTSETHWTWAAVKNGTSQVTTVVDSAGWVGRGAFTAGSLVHGSALSAGLSNRLRLWGKTGSGPPDPSTNARALVGLNWLEVTYWRAFRPITGYLGCNSGDADGEFEILAPGFTDSAAIRVYDVTDSLAPERLTGFSIARNGPLYDVRVQDSTSSATPRRYVIVDRPKTPAAGRVTPVTRRQLYSNASGDYLLIVPEAFLSAMAPLVQLRQSQGLSVVLAPLESVNDEFNGGRHSSHAIKRFVRYGFKRWGTQFVTLFGDGSEDPQKFDPTSGTDWIPIQRIMGPVIVTTTSGSFLEGVPSDPWYGWCVDCADPSLQEKIPDVFVGRLPVNSLAEANAVVSKLVRYESPSADESWRRRMTLVSDDAYSGETFFGGGGTSSTYCRKYYEEVFREINELVHSVIIDEAGLKQSEPEEFNLSYYLPTLPGDIVGCVQTDTCRCNRSDFESRARAIVTPELMNRLNAGRLWFNYQGHANEKVMSHESFYVNQLNRDDKDLLLNDDRPFVYTGFSCHPNAFAHAGENSGSRAGPAYGEDLVTLPARGAIASWASSGYELLPLNKYGHLNVHFARALFANEVRDPWAPSRGARAVLGEVIARTLLNNLKQQPPPSSYEREVGITYTLLGDPATRISIGPPQAMVTANTQPVTSGQPVRLRIGRDSLDVEADVATNVRIDTLSLSRTAPTGAVVILTPADYTVSPAFPDTGAASGRGRQYHVALRDTLLADSYKYTLRSVDRDGHVNPFDIVLTYETVLLADGTTVNDLDAISPTATLALRVLSPKPLDPAADLELRVGGAVQPFQFATDNGDTSGREWMLTWTHAPYPFGETAVELQARGGALRIHRFRVNVTGAELRLVNPIAFPNPFEDELGTFFSFQLESGSPADVLIRVYTAAGKLVYQQKERGLAPGYHQIPWNGLDAEGEKLANGIYLFRILARNASMAATYDGRLVKLRKPNRVDEPTTP